MQNYLLLQVGEKKMVARVVVGDVPEGAITRDLIRLPEHTWVDAA